MSDNRVRKSHYYWCSPCSSGKPKEGTMNVCAECGGPMTVETYFHAKLPQSDNGGTDDGDQT